MSRESAALFLFSDFEFLCLASFIDPLQTSTVYHFCTTKVCKAATPSTSSPIMAPSQLAQLKSALSTAGLNRNSQPKSKSKSNNKAGLTNKDREKKEKRLEDIRASLNKFDVREAKVKNPVFGKGPKNKGVTGTPSQSRSRGLEIVSWECLLMKEEQL